MCSQSRARSGGSDATWVPAYPSNASWEGCAGEALGARQQDDDEHRKDRHRGKDAAHQEVGGLLKQSEQEAGDDGAAVVAHAAERDRDKTIEGKYRRIGKEG